MTSRTTARIERLLARHGRLFLAAKWHPTAGINRNLGSWVVSYADGAHSIPRRIVARNADEVYRQIRALPRLEKSA